MQLPDLAGKSALVTGGNRGIGKAAARFLLQAGARTIITARGREALDAAAAELRELGEVIAVPGDVSNADDMQRLFAGHGPVDIVVNNAGIIGPIAPVETAEPDEWRRNIEINLYGVYLTSHFALPGMISRGWGRIVNVSSGAARGSVTGWSAYSAAKAGVEAFTVVTAREAGPHGVHVNAVRPGIVDTEMQVEIRSSSEESFGTDNVQRFRGYKDRGLLRKPEDPARLTVWLLSPEADDLNGEVLAIDDPEVASRIGLEPMGR